MLFMLNSNWVRISVTFVCIFLELTYHALLSASLYTFLSLFDTGPCLHKPGSFGEINLYLSTFTNPSERAGTAGRMSMLHAH